MSEDNRHDLERRVLCLAPTGKDAELTRAVLLRAGVECAVCGNLELIAREILAGAGALLVAEEALGSGRVDNLAQTIAEQPRWSDLPILLLTQSRADSPVVAVAMELLGNVTVLERPIRVAALVSAVRTAVRGRLRQYQLRDHLLSRERTEEALRESESRFRTLVEGVKDYAIFMIDPHGKATSWNEGVRRLLGFEEAEFLNTDISCQIFTAEDVARGIPERELREAAAQGSASNDRWMRRKDGTRFWASGMTTSLCDPSSHLIGYTKVMRDLTERKRAEEALQEADQRKDEFLAMLAHELRNPLAPIRNSLHILRLTGRDDPGTERVTEIMERQVNHMVRLVDDLLEVSRITRGKIELRKETIELAGVLRNAIETSQPLLDAGRHQLAVSIPPQPLLVDGDPVRLAQVFANLLNNAAKYTPDEGQIWLTARPEGDQIAVSVRDTGVGIPTDMLPRVFEMFMQVERSADRRQGGLGIGLTLVKTLVQMHGGVVEARSEGTGRGSEFIVRLPFAARSSSIRELPENRSSAVLASRRVLVVDDNRDAADSLGLLLRLLGADVQIVHSGPDAIAAMREFCPAVVLLDIGMPGMDGYTVARSIRQQPELRNVTLIAVTGWGQAEDRRRAHEAGFDHHLIKPADMTALKSLLTSLEAPAKTLR